MKIIFAVNRPSAQLNAEICAQNLTKHSVKIINENYIEEITKYKPKLIISDLEPISANFAKEKNIKLIYYSPCHLFDGLIQKTRPKYTSHEFHTLHNLFDYNWPTPDQTLIYSPLSQLNLFYDTKPNYTWIMPYSPSNCIQSFPSAPIAILNNNRQKELTKIINSQINTTTYPANLNTYNTYNIKNASLLFTTGETAFITEALINNISMVLTSTISDIESVINCYYLDRLGITKTIGQIELGKRAAIEQLNKGINFARNSQKFIQKSPVYLHEVI